jgi:hypothetical protein
MWSGKSLRFNLSYMWDGIDATAPARLTQLIRDEVLPFAPSEGIRFGGWVCVEFDLVPVHSLPTLMWQELLSFWRISCYANECALVKRPSKWKISRP